MPFTRKESVVGPPVAPGNINASVGIQYTSPASHLLRKIETTTVIDKGDTVHSRTRPTESPAASQLQSPVNAQLLEELLQNYYDKEYLAEGFRYTFLLGFKGPQSSLTSKNSELLKANPEAVEKNIEETSLCRFAGPFNEPPFSNFKVTPLALREKKESSKYRLLHNLSFQYDHRSVNLNMSQSACRVSYSLLEDALVYLRNNPCCYLAKSDLADAFRQIPLHPTQYKLTGFFYKGYYYARCLPVVCSSACNIFERFLNSFKYLLIQKYKVKIAIKILNDF